MEVWNIRGYLYEIFVAKHLIDNGFTECCKNSTTRGCKVNGKGEIEGRGEYHQIDFSGVYTKLTPYIYPLRVLAECKYYKKPLDKKIIRQYIGVVKDITENYYVPSEVKRSNTESIFDKQIPRFTDIPMIFSVNGFDSHSENLAWAQGINLISHKNIPIFSNIIEIIDELAKCIYRFCNHKTSPYKASDCINFIKFAINNIDSTNSYSSFETKLSEKIEDDDSLNYLHSNEYNFICASLLYKLAVAIKNINTFIIATTDKGTILNLVSEQAFPKELYRIVEGRNDIEYNPNLTKAGVYFETLDNEQQDRVFYFEFNEDTLHSEKRKFYFQPNRQMLSDQFPELSDSKRIDMKKQFVGRLTFLLEINKVNRVLEIEVEFPHETREELNKIAKGEDSYE